MAGLFLDDLGHLKNLLKPPIKWSQNWMTRGIPPSMTSMRSGGVTVSHLARGTWTFLRIIPKPLRMQMCSLPTWAGFCTSDCPEGCPEGTGGFRLIQIRAPPITPARTVKIK